MNTIGIACTEIAQTAPVPWWEGLALAAGVALIMMGVAFGIVGLIKYAIRN